MDEVAQRLIDVLSPSLLAPRQRERRDPRQPQRCIRMRQRLLTRPVIVAIMVRLVWRWVPSIVEVQKALSREGVVGMVPLQVSPHAIAQRLDVLPAAVMGQLFAEVGARVQAQSPPPLPHPRWAPVPEHFPLLAIGDGSTLEALRKKTAVLRERTGLVLVGKMMVLVEAFSHRPLCQVDTEDAAANDKRFAAEFLATLPVGWLSDRLEYRVVLAPALLLMALVLAWFPQAQGLWGLLLVSIGVHTSFAAWGMPSAALAQLARGERLRRTMGGYRLLVDGAVVVAPWLIGTLVGRYGYALPSWITAAGVLLTAGLVTYGLRPARR